MAARLAEICDEVADLAQSARELFAEYLDGSNHNGRGTHRDPVNVLRELGDDLDDLRAAVRELRYEAERVVR
jgi:hypothetical protein